MGWIKRNLFFVIGGAVALTLLGGAGYYIFEGWSSNSETSDKLNEVYDKLSNLQQQKPAPGSGKVDNVALAKTQQEQLAGWVNSASVYFQPIPAIPVGDVTSESFAGALRRTVDALQHEADVANVKLPPKYDFSFAVQRPLVKFSPVSLPQLAAQLGEVKVIAETVFSAGVNMLDGVQRSRVSDEDAGGPQSDYIDDHSVTNDLAVVTPYVVTFRCFTPELARVIAAFSTTSNCFLIKAINVQPANPVASSPDPGQMPPGGIPGDMSRPPGGDPGMAPPSGGAPSGSGRGGLPVVLKEQLLSVSMQLELVKLLPKS